MKSSTRNWPSRLAGIHTFLWRHLPWQSGDRLLQEFREHSGLTPGGDLYQVRDTGQHWVYQPLAMKRLNLPSDNARSTPTPYETVERNGILLRVLTARVEVANRMYTVQVASVVTPFFFAPPPIAMVGICNTSGLDRVLRTWRLLAEWPRDGSYR